MPEDSPNVRYLLDTTPMYEGVPRTVAAIGSHDPADIHAALVNAFDANARDSQQTESDLLSPDVTSDAPGLGDSLRELASSDTLYYEQFKFETSDRSSTAPADRAYLPVESRAERYSRLLIEGLGDLIGRRKNRKKPEDVSDEAWDLNKTVNRVGMRRRSIYVLGAGAVLGATIAAGAATQVHVEPSLAKESLSSQLSSSPLKIATNSEKDLEGAAGGSVGFVIGLVGGFWVTGGRRRVIIAHNAARRMISDATPLDPPLPPATRT